MVNFRLLLLLFSLYAEVQLLLRWRNHSRENSAVIGVFNVQNDGLTASLKEIFETLEVPCFCKPMILALYGKSTLLR